MQLTRSRVSPAQPAGEKDGITVVSDPASLPLPNNCLGRFISYVDILILMGCQEAGNRLGTILQRMNQQRSVCYI